MVFGCLRGIFGAATGIFGPTNLLKDCLILNFSGFFLTIGHVNGRVKLFSCDVTYQLRRILLRCSQHDLQTIVLFKILNLYRCKSILINIHVQLFQTKIRGHAGSLRSKCERHVCVDPSLSRLVFTQIFESCSRLICLQQYSYSSFSWLLLQGKHHRPYDLCWILIICSSALWSTLF